MAKSTQLETVVNMIKERYLLTYTGKNPPASVQEARTLAEGYAAEYPVADDIVCERVDAGGVPAEWIAAPGASVEKVLYFLHGGGYSMGSINTERDMIARTCRAAGVRALAIEYRLAPEHPFPAGLEDSLTAYRWLLSTGTDPNKVVIAGDSAGGGLTLATLVALRDAGDPLPAAGIPISPWVDMEGLGESMTTKAGEDPMVQREVVSALREMYIGDRNPRMPLAAPLYADLTGLPPLLIQVGSAETLLDDSTRFAERAQAAGVEVKLEVWDDMVHVWHVFAPILPEGQQAIEHMGEFIREHTT